MRKVITGLVAAAFLFIGTGWAHSTDWTAQRDKIEERLEIVTAWKMADLNLDRATIEKILEVRRKFVSRRKALRAGLNQDFRKLRSLLKHGAAQSDDKELRQVLEDIREKRSQFQALMDEQFREVGKFLSVRQQAELVLFLKDFQKEMRSLLRPPHGPSGGPAADLGVGPDADRSPDEETGPPSASHTPHGKAAGPPKRPRDP